MRLAQLARKLEVSSAEIVELLKDAGLPIDNHSNSKLTDGQLQAVLMHFGLSEPAAPAEAGEAPLSPEPFPPAAEDANEEQPVSETGTAHEESPPGVIRPAKVELPGLKVVGKIELPAPKKKTEPAAAEDAGAPQAPEGKNPTGRSRRPAGERRPERQPRKNPIALAREREAREALRKKLEEKKKEKELRAHRYYRKLQDAKPQKKSTKHRVSDEYETLDSHSVQPDAPRSLLGRLWRWLKPPTNY